MNRSAAAVVWHGHSILQRLLTALDAAKSAADLSKPVSYGLHRLKGAEKHWSVWVDGNYRLTFAFEGTNVVVVDYRDYH